MRTFCCQHLSNHAGTGRFLDCSSARLIALFVIILPLNLVPPLVVDSFVLVPRRRRAVLLYESKEPTTAVPKEPSSSSSNDTTVPLTPCNRICRYNANFLDGQVCIGCYRETHEIASWASMDATERYWTLLDAMDRLNEATTQQQQQNNDKNNNSYFEGAVTEDELMKQAKYWEDIAKAKTTPPSSSS